MEDIIRGIPGVLKTSVGYTGGTLKDPTYELVKKGDTNHAEAIDIIFDPSKISYEELLYFFFKMHDPTTLNQQGGDVGSQYRSAIFYNNDEQKRIAEKVIQKVDASGKWKQKIITQVVQASKFYDAEQLERGIHVFLDGKEYFDVEEYCAPEGWIRLPAGKARTRTGRPVTITKRGEVTIRYEDI